MTLETIFAQFFDEGGAAHVQTLGGMGDYTLGLVQRLLNQALLQGTQMGLQIEAVARQAWRGDGGVGFIP